MGKLIYSLATSLDGFVSDRSGKFGWGSPEEEVHEFVNERFRSIGTELYGRRMYETMVYWETAHTAPEQPAFILEYARLWQATDKIVYSTTLNEVASARTRIERTFDPATVRKLKVESDLDIASQVRTWRLRRSTPGSSTSTSSSSDRRSLVAAIRSSPTTSASISSCGTSGGSATVWSTCATAYRTARSPMSQLGRQTRLCWRGEPGQADPPELMSRIRAGACPAWCTTHERTNR